jgi:hypothetical protein
MEKTTIKKLEPEPLRPGQGTATDAPPSEDARRTVGEVLAAELRRLRRVARRVA